MFVYVETNILMQRATSQCADFVFTDEEITLYSEGECMTLAYQLHEMTNWQLVGMGAIEDAEDGPERFWCHMLVRTPSGALVDIEGYHGSDEDQEALLRDWETNLKSREIYSFLESSFVFFDITSEERFLYLETANLSPYQVSNTECEAVARKLLAFVLEVESVYAAA